MPVSGAAESACAESLEDNTTSLEESIFDSPRTVPHKTIGSSSDTFPSRCQKLEAGAPDFSYAQALQEPDVPSLDEFLDNSLDQKLVEGSSLEELLSTASSQESITANPQTVPHNTIDGSSRTFPSGSDKLVAAVAESISSISLQEPDVSSSDEFLDSSSEESNTPHNTIEGSLAPASSIGNNILIRRSLRCFEVFYIRIDRRGSFWIYPNLGGPFQSIDETENAINSFLDVLLCERRTGTTKGASNSLSSESTHSDKWYLVQAILDQYNDENNLSGNLALELEDLLRKQYIYENHRWFYHFNFTTKQKEADDNHSTGNKLFFAEVSHMQGKKAWELNCCCMIDSKTKGGHCFGCKNNWSPNMQHPNETDAYIGGHLDGYLPFDEAFSSSDDEDEDNNNYYDDDDDDDDDDNDDYY